MQDLLYIPTQISSRIVRLSAFNVQKSDSQILKLSYCKDERMLVPVMTFCNFTLEPVFQVSNDRAVCREIVCKPCEALPSSVNGFVIPVFMYRKTT